MYGYLKNVFEQPFELEKTINDLLDNKEATLKKIGTILSESDHIVLTSMGSAQNSLIPMYNALMNSGKYVSLIEASNVIHNSLYFNDPGTVFVIMSRSGESREVYDIVRILQERGITSIGITMTKDSSLDTFSSVSLLDVCSFDEKICLKAYSSMALCGLICVAYMKGETINRSAYVKMFRWMAENQEKILKVMEGIDFFKEAHSYVFLSRDFGVGCCKAGSLWLEEIAFVSGDVSSIDAFYHGPIRSILSSSLADNMIVPVYLDVHSDERSKKIWSETVGAAKKSIYIGENEDAPADYKFIYPHFDVPDESLSLLLCMYTQLLAYQCCITKGYTPGVSLGIPENRWVVS